jgi:hypothetical protein
LQALFMTASVLMTKSTTRTMNNEVFIAVSPRLVAREQFGRNVRFTPKSGHRNLTA